ncbi:MAG: NAD(P)-dependent glycerol-3-phosphate dehydrogenase [Planctomycetales bacterium]|nr:NAD(P)-dependent glycerol-3-phosphate dehydrogenase [Planctomycetales bacterium]
MSAFARVGVLGDGGWGTAVALLAHARGRSVTIWGAFPDYVEEQRRTRQNPRFLPGIEIPEGIAYTADAAAVADADLLVSAVPTPFLRSVARKIAPHLRPKRTPVLSLTKGLEQETLARPSEILRAELGRRVPIAVLSGPSHAIEVARGLPTTVAVASASRGLASRIQRLLSGDAFRVYTNADLAGLELGGAVKNVIAVAAGICDGLGYGDNTKAALITRGLVEIAAIGRALGARRETFTGLAGLGDLVTTCTSRHGRNRAIGEAIGGGKSLPEVLAGMAQVPEGAFTVKAVRELARRRRVPAPISEEVYRVLYEGKDPRAAVRDLMTRPLGRE